MVAPVHLELDVRLPQNLAVGSFCALNHLKDDANANYLAFAILSNVGDFLEGAANVVCLSSEVTAG